MKIKWKDAVALLAISSVTVLSAQENVTVKGKIDGIKSGRLYLLAQTGENTIDTLGTTTFSTPDFILEGNVSEPVVAQIVVEKYSGGFILLAEPGNTYEALLTNDASAYIHGGKLHDEWQKYLKHQMQMRQKKEDLNGRYETLRAENKYRSASAVNDTLQRLSQQIGMETTDFLRRHDDLITAYTLQENALQKGLEESRQMYNMMGPGAKATLSARIMKERIERMEKSVAGKMAPDFTLTDPQQRSLTMSKVKAKLKIIDFWASWCGPCRLNNPLLRKLYEEYHNKGLEIIGVSLDNSSDRWKDAIEKDGLNWINVSSLKGWKCPVARQYSVTGVPAVFVLDEENRIIATNLKGDKLRVFIEERLR